MKHCRFCGASEAEVMADSYAGGAIACRHELISVFHQPDALAALELYAWVGEDEFGSGEIGLKQGLVPAGMIPLVAIRRDKVDRLKSQMEVQARAYGKKISLVRFVFAEVIDRTSGGE